MILSSRREQEAGGQPETGGILQLSNCLYWINDLFSQNSMPLEIARQRVQVRLVETDHNAVLPGRK
jgi:hypothetical protein